jgi:hypothetical protein
MPDYPPLSTQVIGQAESALGALLEPLLAGTGITFHQWLVLTVTAAEDLPELNAVDGVTDIRFALAAWFTDPHSESIGLLQFQ